MSPDPQEPPGAADTARCRHCGHEVPAGRFCVRCGAMLESRAGERGAHFAAAPHEHRLVPSAVSTLFPHLPRATQAAFRALLATGVALIAALALAGLFPIGLIAAAVLVPLLFVVYLREVDLYEDEPALVVAATLVWGAAAGVAVGLLRDAVQDSGAALASPTTGHALVWNGVLVPLIGFAAALAGPLALLPYRKFNDALDGVTFAGAAAVTFAGAELLTSSSALLAGGVAPAGLVAPWVARLLTLGVAVPILAGALSGAVGGSLWLRYRAPAGRRRGAGPLGHPLLALALAALALVGAGVVQIALERWAALAVLVGLDLAAVLWLRLLIDVGLREERDEAVALPAQPCANCGRRAPAQAFCSFCGVARRALPKRASADRPLPWAAMARFGVALALLTGIAVGATIAAAPASVRPPCRAASGCTTPPRTIGSGGLGAPVRQRLRSWRGAGGVTVSYDTRRWRVRSSTPGVLDIVYAGELELRIELRAGASGGEPAVAQRLGVLSGRYPDLVIDTAHEPPAFEIGGVGATGELLAGHDLDGVPVEVLIEAASQGATEAVVTAWTTQPAHSSASGSTSPFDVLVNADVVLESFRWPSARSVTP